MEAKMDFQKLVVELAQHMTPEAVALFVALIATEVVANLSFINANSLGHLVVKALQEIFTNLWSKVK
jgi:hypothetical protein